MNEFRGKKRRRRDQSKMISLFSSLISTRWERNETQIPKWTLYSEIVLGPNL